MRTIIVVILFSLSRCGYSFAQTISDVEVSKFLTAYRADFSKSILDGKPEILGSYYKHDVRLMTEYQRTIIGKDNVLAYYTALLDRFDVKQFDKTKLEILDLGTMVAETGKLKVEMKLKHSDKIYKIEGKYLDIWDKSDGKNMELITSAWNYNSVVDDFDNLHFNNVEVVDVALRPHVPVNNNISFELAAFNLMIEATVSQHDAKMWSQLYADDAMIFTSRQDITSGRSAIDKYLEDHCTQLPVFEKLSVRNDRIDNLGSYVIEYASHVAVWRTGDYSGVGLGKDIRIWRREKDGALKMFRHMGMYD